MASQVSPKPPPLSYADRAKKGKNVGAQNSLSSQRGHSQSVSASSTTTAISTAPSSSSTISSSSNIDIVKSASLEANPQSQSTPILRLSEDPDQQFPPPSNKDVAKSGPKTERADSSADPPPPLIRNTKQASPPVVNVWNIRKEKLAQARALSQTQPESTTAPQSLSAAKSQGASPNTLRVEHAEASLANSPRATVPPSKPSQPSTENTLPVNGHSVNEGHDPFVVHPNLAQSSRIPIPPDSENWPAVGNTAASPSSPYQPSNNGSNGSSEVLVDSQRAEDKSSTTVATKKSDKPKWVPIPPEELQAAADAQRRNRRSSRPGSHHQNQSRANGPSASGSVSGSVSGPPSQGQSRAHSAAGMHSSGSHGGSASHSQAQSRTGSAHSSPRQAFVRGKRLPDDTAAPNPPSSANRSMRSSRAPSPQASAAPNPGPLNTATPRVQPPPQTSATNHRSPDPSLPSPFYQTIPPVVNSTASRSYHSTPASNSPASQSYSLPIAGPGPIYAAPQSVPGPVSLPYTGSSGYPMYSPYYVYGHPYVPWTSGQDSSAMYPPVAHLHSPAGQVYPTERVAREGPIGIPPVTMVDRVPPPAESEAVAGYRDIGFVMPPPASYTHAEGNAEQGKRSKEISFGTIQPSLVNTAPSTSPASPVLPSEALNEPKSASSLGLDVNPHPQEERGEMGIEKPFAGFTIGVDPGEPGPSRIRSRTRTHSKSGVVLHERIKTAPAQLSGDVPEPAHALVEDEGKEKKVIDLTDSETKWEFGTATKLESVETPPKVEQAGNDDIPHAPAPTTDITPVIPDQYPPPHPQPTVVQHPQTYSAAPEIQTVPSTFPTQPTHSPLSPEAPYPSPDTTTNVPAEGHTVDEFEVKNYGYGFGRANSSGYVAGHPHREERARERDARDFHPGGRPRRGSYGGFGYDNRGGYSGRRGRGMGGFGRGHPGRGFGRGGYQPGHIRPSFNVPQPLHPPPESSSYYSAPQSQPSGTTYFHPAGYDPYTYAPYAAPIPAATSTTPTQPAPPVPLPITPMSFPLDPTRYYLLGQLEYYLSAQNLAQDFFLRQQIDDRGWIHIPLIASFPRVRQLTPDQQLVRDVLTLSSEVEVNGDWVRIHQWSRYVLPTASRSVVEDFTSQNTSTLPLQTPAEDSVDTASTSHEGEDDDEDEVEFVLENEANRSWTPERNDG